MSPFISAANIPSAYVSEVQGYYTNGHMSGSFALGGQRFDLFRRLDKLCEECSAEGWDGENAKPISSSLQKTSSDFIKALPWGLEDPELGAESDGSITLEWYRSPENVVSVSISPDGNIYYASLLGVVRKRGSYPIQLGITDDLMRIINEVIQD